jgi:hypothetical protein
MFIRVIFGAALTLAACQAALAQSLDGQIYGTIKMLSGAKVVVQLRTGNDISVDLSQAIKSETTITPQVGESVFVLGTIVNGAILASSMQHAKSPPAWGPDILK